MSYIPPDDPRGFTQAANATDWLMSRNNSEAVYDPACDPIYGWELIENSPNIPRSILRYNDGLYAPISAELGKFIRTVPQHLRPGIDWKNFSYAKQGCLLQSKEEKQPLSIDYYAESAARALKPGESLELQPGIWAFVPKRESDIYIVFSMADYTATWPK